MKRKRRIYFSKIHLNIEYIDENNYTYSMINDSEIYKWVYDELFKNNRILLLSKIYCTNSLFKKCFIELKCDKNNFYCFCNHFINFFDKYIEDIEF